MRQLSAEEIKQKGETAEVDANLNVATAGPWLNKSGTVAVNNDHGALITI